MDINGPRCRRRWGDDGQPFSASSDPLSSKVVGSVEAMGNTVWEVRSFYFLLFVLCFLHIDEKM